MQTFARLGQNIHIFHGPKCESDADIAIWVVLKKTKQQNTKATTKKNLTHRTKQAVKLLILLAHQRLASSG